MLALREKYVALHHTSKGSMKRLPKVGDTVLIQLPSVPHATWPIGIILKLDKRQATSEVKFHGISVHL